MSATVRATCPGCQNVIKIPAEWAERAVKCKKCGTVLQGKSRTPEAEPNPPVKMPPLSGEPMPSYAPPGAEPASPTVPPASYPTAPAPHGGVPGYHPEGVPGAAPGHYPGYPTGQPGYGYPPAAYGYPPGYGAGGPPPGYPAAPPAGPTGYPQPGYPQPGYPYGIPPGYPVPPGYGPPPGYPGAHPQPGYPYPGQQPAPVIPAPVSTAAAFNMESTAESDDLPTIRKPGRYRRDTGKTGTFIWIFFALLLAGCLVAGAIIVPKVMKQKGFGEQADGKGGDSQVSGQIPPITASTTPKRASVSAPFPRRMLVMNVTKYLYANTLTDGRAPSIADQLQESIRQLAYHWQIPVTKDNNQLYVLADTAPKNPRPMLKPIIEQAYTEFCQTSRPQDRVVIYYGGHAVEKDGKGYLVPVDGDISEVATLLPLENFWKAVESCKAQQRIVIFDVCRLNEDEDTFRPGSEKMTAGLETVLHKAPRGVQVITTCSADQNALEYRRPPDLDARDNFAGSLFLGAMKSVAYKNRGKAVKASQEDPIPIGSWMSQAEQRMEEVAKLTGKPAPRPKMSGAEGPLVAYNAEDKAAEQFEFAPVPKGASPEQITKITSFIDLPLLRGTRIDSNGQMTSEEESFEGSVVFPEEVMKSYQPETLTKDEIAKEPEKFKIRQVTLKALEVIRKEWKSTSAAEGQMNANTGTVGLRTTFAGETNDNVKKLIAEEQETPARIILELEDIALEMDQLREQLKDEPSKFWQANFLYALAQTKARLAFMHEYNYALGNIRTDSLPTADSKKMSQGVQMVSTDKMKSKKDIRDIGDESKEIFTQLADEHKGTPWAVQAKRWKVVALGLEWRPFSAGGKVVDDDVKN